MSYFFINVAFEYFVNFDFQAFEFFFIFIKMKKWVFDLRDFANETLTLGEYVIPMRVLLYFNNDRQVIHCFRKYFDQKSEEEKNKALKTIFEIKELVGKIDYHFPPSIL